MADYNFLFNPLESFFGKLRPKQEVEEEKAIVKNSIAASEDDLISKNKNLGNYNGGILNNYIQFEQVFQTKEQKISKYREMEDYPEISDALDIVSDEAIIQDDEGKIVSLTIKGEADLPKNIVKQIRDESEYLMENVFKIKERGWPVFRRFLSEGETYLEKIVDDKKKSIVSLKIIPPFRITPVYESSIIKGYYHGTLKKDANGSWTEDNVFMPSTQVAYINWGEYIRGDITDPKSYLWSAIRPYNQLRNLEDALMVYRLSRAIEKRVFNIEVGQMPAGKAREYLSKMINQFKKVINYDSNTGQIQQSQNLMSLNEDFWFTQNNGQGSKVETLQSGMNLGELKDVEYFLKKLYKTLKMPKSRWEDSNSLFNSGKGGEITREEIKFNQFVERIQGRFKKLFVDCLLTQLKLKGIAEEYINPNLYDYTYTQSNLFAEYQKIELLESNLSLMNTAFPLIWSPINPQGVFDKEFAMKHFFRISEEEYLENKRMLEAKKNEALEDHYDDKLATAEIEAGVAEKVSVKKEKEKAKKPKAKNESELGKNDLEDYEML